MQELHVHVSAYTTNKSLCQSISQDIIYMYKVHPEVLKAYMYIEGGVSLKFLSSTYMYWNIYVKENGSSQVLKKLML